MAASSERQQAALRKDHTRIEHVAELLAKTEAHPSLSDELQYLRPFAIVGDIVAAESARVQNSGFLIKFRDATSPARSLSRSKKAATSPSVHVH
jgi:hypothetical protein